MVEWCGWFDGNMLSQSVKLCLPSVKHVVSLHRGPSIIWSNGTDNTDGKLRARSVKQCLPSVKHVGRHHTGSSIIWSNGTDGTGGNM